MLVMFVDNPNGRHRGRVPDGTIRELPVAATYEQPLLFLCGVMASAVYEIIGPGLNPGRHLAVYRGLRRIPELPRRFDPSRLR